MDYRALNEVTKKDSYPLPRADDIMESLSGARYFSYFDLVRGYWQFEVEEMDREKLISPHPMVITSLKR